MKLLKNRRLWFGLAAVAAILAIRYTGVADTLSLETLRQNREALTAFVRENYLLAALAYIGLYATVVSFSFPGAVFLTLSGGFLFGAIWGTLFTVIGATVGATIGVARRDHVTARGSSWLSDPYELVGSVDRPWHRQSAYTQLDWLPARQVSVQAGLRLDDASPGGAVLNPRLGANWRPARDWTVRALTGRAYRRPNLYETYFTDGLTSRANPDLKSESLWTWEAGLECRRDGITATINTFQNIFDDRIVITRHPVDSLLQYANVGRLRISGIESELAGNPGHGVRWRASWTYATFGEDDHAAVSTVNFAGHVGQASAVFPIPAGPGHAAVFFHAVGPRRSAAGDRVPGYGLTDIVWSTEPLPGRLEAAIRVRNLLNQSWSDPGGEEHATSRIPGWSRTADLVVRIKF